MNMVNSVILEGVVSVSLNTAGFFSVDNVRYEGGEKVDTFVACKLSEAMKQRFESKIVYGRKVRVVGYLSSLCVFVEHLELKDRVVKSGKYTFTSD